MNAQARSTSPANTPSSSTILHGSWLWLARLLWLAFIIITLGIFIRGIPLRAESMRNRYRPAIGVNPYWDRNGGIAVWQWWDYPAYRTGILDGDTLVAVNGVTPNLKPGFPGWTHSEQCCRNTHHTDSSYRESYCSRIQPFLWW